MPPTTAALALIACLAAPGQEAPELACPASARTALGVTLYQDGRALVRDRRRMNLPAGTTRLAFQDVAVTLNARSAQLRPLSGAPWAVREQDFEFHLISPATLQALSLGRPVGQRDLPGTATLASTPQPGPRRATASQVETDLVLQGPEGVFTAPAESLTFSALPEGLRDRPTLLQTLSAPEAGPREVELVYLADQLPWTVQYVADLAPDARTLDLHAFLTLHNRAGIPFPDATLQFVAGEVNRVWETPDDDEPPPPRQEGTVVEVVACSVAEEKLQEFILFTLPRPTTLKADQTKQLAFFEASRLPVRLGWNLAPPAVDTWDTPESLAWHPRPGTNLALELEVPNARGSRLGRALPKGGILLRQEGQILGQGNMENTPIGEPLTFSPNPPGEGYQATRALEARILGRTLWRDGSAEGRISLSNALDQPVRVTLSLQAGGGTEFSRPSGRIRTQDAGFLTVDLDLPARGEILYRIRTRPTSR